MQISRDYSEHTTHNKVRHVYYNATFVNDTNKPYIPAKYSANLTNIILDDAEQYNLAVVRFNVPTELIPFVYFRVQSGLGQTNKDLGVYSMSLSYNGITYTKNLIFQSRANNQVTPPNPPSQNGGEQEQSIYYNVYNIDNMLDMINFAIDEAMTDLLTANPVLPPLESPFFVWDSVAESFSCIVERDFVNNGLELFCNDFAGRFFSGFSLFFQNDGQRYYRINLYDNFLETNSYDVYGTVPSSPSKYIKVVQDLDNLEQWGELQGIVFKTSLIPIRSEMTNGPVNKSNILIDEQILTDYEVPNWRGGRGDITFVNNSVYRFIDLVSTQALRSIDMEIFYRDRVGKLLPLVIFQNSFRCRIKLAFIMEGLVS